MSRTEDRKDDLTPFEIIAASVIDAEIENGLVYVRGQRGSYPPTIYVDDKPTVHMIPMLYRKLTREMPKTTKGLLALLKEHEDNLYLVPSGQNDRSPERKKDD